MILWLNCPLPLKVLATRPKKFSKADCWRMASAAVSRICSMARAVRCAINCCVTRLSSFSKAKRIFIESSDNWLTCEWCWSNFSNWSVKIDLVRSSTMTFCSICSLAESPASFFSNSVMSVNSLVVTVLIFVRLFWNSSLLLAMANTYSLLTRSIEPCSSLYLLNLSASNPIPSILSMFRPRPIVLKSSSTLLLTAPAVSEIFWNSVLMLATLGCKASYALDTPTATAAKAPTAAITGLPTTKAIETAFNLTKAEAIKPAEAVPAFTAATHFRTEAVPTTPMYAPTICNTGAIVATAEVNPTAAFAAVRKPVVNAVVNSFRFSELAKSVMLCSSCL